ncbi:MAG: glycosyltransferase [Gemmatimonadetes bacterium]|nr:glycosyltransferase family 4 protein [Gemmatimonadota bacterium]NIR78972.1 glycosyltransferase family 4 protein [Gemmatimonadota bacterium]NIT87621.1 glycosyltransferase family 4 protein [Gemmatimonadota bacterium]NIU31483.1 glycosyltransferase family 4 protein [Gemmatimonadota bacterium]NIU36150.1 glycosyltransferase [Gemmatimonadota bacterium]
MRTTFLVPAADTYGGDRVIGRYARGLAERGHDVRVLSLGRPRSLSFYRDLDVETLGMESFPSSRLDYARAALRAVSALPRPGVLVATWTPTLPVAAAARLLRRTPRLVWLAQDYPEMFEGLSLESRLLAGGARFADAVVAVSEACARHHGEERFPERFEVIHSGIDEVFLDAGREGGGAAVEGGPGEGILFVGAPVPRKGWPDFLEATERLREWGLRVPVTVVTSSPPRDTPPLPTRIRPGLDDEELASLYAAHRAYVCASRAEGWGLPALEAMAVGTPVVTTLHEGCRAYARPEENCLGVPVGDAGALAAAVRGLLESPELARRLVRGGRETAEAFTWPAAIRRFEAVCLGPGSGGGAPP